VFDLQGQSLGVWDPDLYVNGTTSTILGFIFQNGIGTGTLGSVLRINSGSLLISMCDFTGNAGAGIGAVYIAYSADSTSPPSLVEFNSCTFTNNTGGTVAIFHRPNRMVAFQSCTFTGNQGESGAAIFADTSSVVITNCIFQSNTASSSDGGAVLSQVTTSNNPSSFKLVIIESTFTNNVAAIQGYASLSSSVSMTSHFSFPLSVEALLFSMGGSFR
jgi:hypothetical protein